MAEELALRIKSAMILFQLERELGRYFNEHRLNDTSVGLEPTGQAPSETEKSGSLRTLSDGQVEGTYFVQVLNLAEGVSKGSSEHPSFKELRRLFDAYELTSIRNAVAHPNRRFPETYWHRCAALATDGVISRLQFGAVLAAYQSACSGRIEEPPDEWMQSNEALLPHKLPARFDHSITGLRGREKDLRELEKQVQGPRAQLVAVVAPGGIGKTSLVLEYLSTIVHSTRAPDFCECVAFVSLKREVLTETGPRIIDAPSTISEVRRILSEQLGELLGVEPDLLRDGFSPVQTRKPLIFLDNLETLLRDGQEEFINFFDSLPPTWRVIVTSRIRVDSARNIPLGELERPQAMYLARLYFRVRGLEISDSRIIESIADSSRFNPLAMRLIIDRYASGEALQESIGRTQQEIVDFAFSSLVNGLSATSKRILEATFIIEQPTRADLCDALGLRIDEVAAAIGELTKTSLLRRVPSEGDEFLELGEGIRDLLLSAPGVDLEARSAVSRRLRETRAAAAAATEAQAKRGVSPLDPMFVPEGVAPHVTAAVGEAARALRSRKRERVAEAEQRLRIQEEANPASSVLARVRGRLLYELNDPRSAERAYRKALSTDPQDVSARFSLAQTLLQHDLFADVEEHCKHLIDAGWGESATAGVQYASKLWGTRLRAMLFDGRLNDVFTLTDAWKTSDISAVLGVARASAYRRLLEPQRANGASNDRIRELLAKACRTLDFLIQHHGYTKPITSESGKLIQEMVFQSEAGQLPLGIDNDWQALADFVIAHAESVLQGDDHGLVRAKQAVTPSHEYPQTGRSEASRPSVIDNVSNQADLEGAGFTQVRVTNIPEMRGNFPQYLFAKDRAGVDYFIHIEQFEGRDWAKWVMLQVGSEVWVKHEPSKKGTTQRKATEARMS